MNDAERAEKQRRFAVSHLRKLLSRYKQSVGGIEEGRDMVEWLAIVAMANPEVINGRR
jgi:hypothetical protein